MAYWDPRDPSNGSGALYPSDPFSDEYSDPYAFSAGNGAEDPFSDLVEPDHSVLNRSAMGLHHRGSSSSRFSDASHAYGNFPIAAHDPLNQRGNLSKHPGQYMNKETPPHFTGDECFFTYERDVWD